ncbi:hypothetical protein AOC36_00535 [Erysipelothrix larvae]|uniref:PRD domain-containing protein n=1 Tax=Erysipelothrix larvae TaxID=1514105 RepID=A0A0X8H1X0_9FIRM|nr:PRD domain-containing protein [Erysipelothrix larvae]AMC94602.1 hypothetical protein AOC36_00535 [Erysipelothrix larvae]
MKIIKILNNNVIVSIDEDGREVVAMGSGLAFGRRVGDTVSDQKVDKLFRLEGNANRNHYYDLLQEIPMEYLTLSDEIVRDAKTKMGKPLSDIVYITLSDHIYQAISRAREGIQLRNALLWDIKHFYPMEYEIGMMTQALIQERFGVSLLDDEAGFIALHFVNAEVGSTMEHIVEITKILQEVTNVIRYFFKVKIDESTVHFYRYITHIKFFAQRLVDRKTYDGSDDDELLELVKRKYKNSYDCANEIKRFILKQYNYSLSGEEILYLTIHIQRLIYGS